MNNQKWSESFFIKSTIAGMTFLTSVVNLIVAIINLVKGQETIAIIAIVGTIVFAIIGVIVLSLIRVQRNSGVKSQQDYETFTLKVSNVTHEILHKIRDSMYYMEYLYNNGSSSEDVSNFEQSVTQDVLQLVDLISNKLSEVVGKDVRACIKCIDYTEKEEEDISRMKLITFARSGQRSIVEVMQEHRRPISITDNTDFLEILQRGTNRRQRQFFYEKNLKEFDRKLRDEGDWYKNTNPNWENDYITTIVCPIRLNRMFETPEGTCTEYDLIGFLCVDSLDEDAFCNEYSNFCLDLLKGISDILYVYLERFITYYNDIKEEI